MAIDKNLLDQLLAGRDAQELFAKDGLLDELKKALSERMLSAELDDHLENEGNEGASNRRNGSSRKTMLTGTSKVTLEVPRDRAGTFDPKLIAKRRTFARWTCAEVDRTFWLRCSGVDRSGWKSDGRCHPH